ncbi:AsmA-like C-terminal region-containing protein [Flavobacterium sp. Fl-77]|uniref:AsmA-like C-terminal region-containing protein n=1 Tax=Flavobacterium flavipigmentatum TaxID=2893884 RepID=A0AAJ2SF55_9FLAO|nr:MULTISPECIES: AsmA-like C-terminal region-containing protein [unclassified Flavobacterium]MDX6183768.1 AsmA-like C-terminal region-containing protein [Flavobacterium sp. Fl-33]MDX6187271.1 AsmA-like C-terminal region-containing protein [Flavobacterium sp. Fl-77]UFH38086.1 AsmA family protein [Flavobacterium sp. F-70]
MSSSLQHITLKTLKITGIIVASTLLLLFLIPMLFPGTIAAEVKKIANQRLDTKLDFSKSRLSFFTHFPSLTVSLDNLSMTGSTPFNNDTLLKAEQVAFGINLKKLLFDDEVKIYKLYVSKAYINIMVNQKGEANYNIYVAPKDKKNKDTTEEGTAIRLERIDFEDCHIKYNDRSAKVLVDAKGFNYVGKGNLSEDIFDLSTAAKIDTVDFYYGRTAYLRKKEVHADLITTINTHALSFILRKNELHINKLPLRFTGLFTILKEGYKINIKAASDNSTLKDLFSVLPPEYSGWLEDTQMSGRSDLLFTFKGDYNVSKKQKPDLAFNMKIKDGSINYKNAVVPLTHLEMNLNAIMPSLDLEKLMINLRTLRFKVGNKDHFSAFLQSKGFSEMNVKARIKGILDLATIDKSLGLHTMELKGILKTDLEANGLFSASQKLFPKTKGGVSLQNGWLKTDSYPNPITNITFVANVLNKKGTFKDLILAVAPASFVFEGNPVYARLALTDFSDLTYNAKVKGELNVGKIYKVFAQKGMDVKGWAKADFSLRGKQSYATNGQYDQLDNRGTLELKNIKATSELFPKSFYIKQGNFRFQNEKMWWDKCYAYYGKSDFDIDGYLLNTINYFLESKGTLSGNFNVKSKLIDIDEFMALKKGENNDRNLAIEYSKEDNPKMSGVVLIPKNLNVAFNTVIEKVAYNGLLLKSISGKTGITKGQFFMQNTTFNIIDCAVAIDATYKDESPTMANFDLYFRANDFSVEKAYKEISMFKKMVSVADKAKGIITIDYKIKGDLNGNMSPIYGSLKGDGVIKLEEVQIKGLKLFDKISTATGQKGFDNPDLKGIEIKSSIDNNLIHIQPFTFRVATFRPTIKGTTSFDGLLDLRMRLGLPPFGIIGIPIVITGTHQNPKIKVLSKTGKKIDDAIYDEKNNKVIKREKVSGA